MIIEKTIKGEDGINRKWLYDTEKQEYWFSGLAKDFSRTTIIHSTTKSAQEIIDEVTKELDYTL